jgi:pyridoxal phosphate enzyme (YggS family)
MRMSIKENYLRIREEIPEHVTIVLAAKTRTREEMLEVIDAGAADIGENYVQEAERLQRELGKDAKRVRWHMIGHLQKNKINKALGIFDVIQTVDSLQKAVDVDTRAAREERVVPVYIEVNIGSELTKAGLEPDYPVIEGLVEEIVGLDNVRLEGLMTMGPRFGDPEDSRPYFRKTRKIFNRINERGFPDLYMKTLSMGMSNSYRVAIEEGSNMIRLGSVIFGEREV